MPADVEADLHAHCQALRSLARALVGDGHADDLVQDTALAALQQPLPKRSLPAWLANVLRFLAHKHHRGERRRARREQAAARPEAEPPADRAVETGDSLRRLTDHVLALPQPYREVVLLRHLHELTPGAIAQRTGTPLATVKSQLQRGLGMLRQRLQERGGDWRAGLCFAFALEPLPAAAALTTNEVLLMASGVKLATCGGLAVLAAAAALFFVLGDPPVTGAVAPPTSEPASVMASSPEVGAPTAPATDEAAATRRTEAAAAADTAAGPLATLRSRCVDEAGLPLAGIEAKFTARSRSNESMTEWLRKHAKPEPIALATSSDGDGRFAFRFAPLPPLTFDLALTGPGRADIAAHWPVIAADAVIDLGEIAMPPGVRVRGVLLDSDGAAVAKVLVYISRDGRGETAALPRLGSAARTGADGRFEIGGNFAPGEWRIHCGDDREVLEGAKAKFVAPAVDLRVVVRPPDPARMIQGTVVDERGLPVASASVRARSGSQRYTDAEGRFLMHRRDDDPEAMQLTVDKTGCEVLEPAAVPWGTHDLRLTLPAVKGQVVHVVRAEGGTPVEHYSLYVARVSRPGESVSSADGGLRSSGSHAFGRANLRLRGGSYLVLIEPDDATLAIGGPVPFEVTAGGNASAVVHLTAQTERTIRLQRHDGSPVAGARAQLYLPPTSPLAPDLTLLPLSQWSTNETRTMHGLLIDAATTDGNGEVRLHGAHDGSYRLLLPGPGHAPQRLDDVRCSETEPLVITVTTGATLRGRCGPPAALADLRRRAGSEPFFAPSLTLRQGGGKDQFPRQQDPPIPLADDGSFAIEHVPPGTWQLHLLVTISRSDDGTNATGIEVDRVVLREGETTEARVDISGFQTGEIDAVVLHNGVPLAGARLRPTPVATPGTRELRTWTSLVTTDAEGHFRCDRARGPYRLEWHPDPGQRLQGLRAGEMVTVVAGETVTQTFHFHTGTLRIRLRDAGGTPAANVWVELRDAAGERRHGLSTGPDGCAECLVEVGDFACKTLPAHLVDRQAQEQVHRNNPGNADPLAPLLLSVGNVTVLEGKAVTVELRLPADYRR